jgi:hypothetical protein
MYVGKKGTMAQVVIDDKPGTLYADVLPDSLLFSEDSNHTIYMASAYKKQILVADGRESSPYDVIASFPTVSGTNGFQAFTAMEKVIYKTVWKP